MAFRDLKLGGCFRSFRKLAVSDVLRAGVARGSGRGALNAGQARILAGGVVDGILLYWPARYGLVDLIHQSHGLCQGYDNFLIVH